MTDTIAHEFVTSTGRCRWCGTRQAMHEVNPQNCVPRWTNKEPLRPEPARREFASEDFNAIGARLAELRAEHDAELQWEPGGSDA